MPIHHPKQHSETPVKERQKLKNAYWVKLEVETNKTHIIKKLTHHRNGQPSWSWHMCTYQLDNHLHCKTWLASNYLPVILRLHCR